MDIRWFSFKALLKSNQGFIWEAFRLPEQELWLVVQPHKWRCFQRLNWGGEVYNYEKNIQFLRFFSADCKTIFHQVQLSDLNNISAYCSQPSHQRFHCSFVRIARNIQVLPIFVLGILNQVTVKSPDFASDFHVYSCTGSITMFREWKKGIFKWP